MHFDTDITSEWMASTLPLQSEVKSVIHFLNQRNGKIRSGLDIGFNNAGVSRSLRQAGGYWMTVETNEARRAFVASSMDAETVLAAGRKGELPFEDKQFDVVIVSSSVFSANPKEASELIRECHRVIKAGGHIIFTVIRKKTTDLGPAIENAATGVTTALCGYSEAAVFQLIRDGFDVLGFRYSCRFFVQLISSWEMQQRQAGIIPGAGMRILYSISNILDTVFLFFTKGYQLTVFGHRKGWREKRSTVLSNVTPVSDAILSDPRRGAKSITSIRFR
ncbi:MAG: class I SAM-dependent methyltransferase [bacterium]